MGADGILPTKQQTNRPTKTAQLSHQTNPPSLAPNTETLACPLSLANILREPIWPLVFVLALALALVIVVEVLVPVGHQTETSLLAGSNPSQAQWPLL